MPFQFVSSATGQHLASVLNLHEQEGWGVVQTGCTEGQMWAILSRPSDWAAPFRAACGSAEQLRLVDACAAAMDAAADPVLDHAERVRRVRAAFRAAMSGQG
jgi:hypothetical protein